MIVLVNLVMSTSVYTLIQSCIPQFFLCCYCPFVIVPLWHKISTIITKACITLFPYKVFVDKTRKFSDDSIVTFKPIVYTTHNLYTKHNKAQLMWLTTIYCLFQVHVLLGGDFNSYHCRHHTAVNHSLMALS